MCSCMLFSFLSVLRPRPILAVKKHPIPSPPSPAAHLQHHPPTTPKMTAAAGVQRIYIGGIDPQRLSIDDVSSRLRRLVDVVSIETPASKASDDFFVNVGPSFFYLNARCPPAPDGDDAAPSATDAAKASPLQVLSKAYNNVKWKGCTLRVEEARPHFLDRLRLEREERERKKRQEEGKTQKRENP